MSNRRRYTGKLATPIVCPAPPEFWGAVTDKRVREFLRKRESYPRDTEKRIDQERSNKLALLLKHYGICNHADMRALALALAAEHVPGFKIVRESKSKRGRRKKWDGLKLQTLFDTVVSLKEQHNFTDRQALQFMTNNPAYSKTWGHPSDRQGQNWIETLESRLHDAKRYVRYIESQEAWLRNAFTSLPRKKFRKL